MTATEPAAPAVVNAAEVAALRLGEIDPSEAVPFPRDSMMRRVSSEPVVGALLQRVLLMDVAHPKVGTGVDDHSGFVTQPLRRGIATADAAVRLVFGDREMALRAARHVYHVHDHINGTLDEPMPTAPPPDSYTAHDASLLLWVWATLVDTTTLAYQRWVSPLTDTDADAYYADMCTWGRFFGIPADLLPADRVAFEHYLESMLDDAALGSSAVSRRVAHSVLYPPARSVPDVGVRPLRALSVSLLDPRLRERFGLELDRRDRRLAERLDRQLMRWYRRVPAPVRTSGPQLYLGVRAPIAAVLKLLGKPLDD